jgi:class 3 adenylate cyclase
MTNDTSLPADCTVLFADLAGSTQLYERVGDTLAFKLVDQSLHEMRNEIEQRSGRVVKHMGDGLMAVFADANSAADAAIRIHKVIRDLPLSSGQKLAVRLGFHSGPVVESDNDVFGDTVNIAARLLELASPGRAITSIETARRLDPEWRMLLHPMKPRTLRGVSRRAELFELVCESAGDLTVVHGVTVDAEEKPELRLYLGALSVVLDERKPSLRLGRDPSSDLCVTDTRASRQHAQIELRGDKFVLIDRSSNGTFVSIDGEKEFVLSREEVVLRKHGHLALGRSCLENAYAIGFVCI